MSTPCHPEMVTKKRPWGQTYLKNYKIDIGELKQKILNEVGEISGINYSDHIQRIIIHKT